MEANANNTITDLGINDPTSYINDSSYIENNICDTFSYDMNSPHLGIIIFHFNVRSLTKNFNRLEMLLLFPIMPHLIAISETKLNAKSNINSIMLPHYTFCHSSSYSAAGGVGIYINDSLQYRIRDDLKFLEEGNENTWIKIIKNNSIFCNKNHQYLKNIMVGSSTDIPQIASKLL